MPTSTRRGFLAATGGALAAGAIPAQLARSQSAPVRVSGRAVAIASGNGLRAVEKARAMLVGGADPLDACVEGVAIIENDPEDMTVGYGGLPNEEGVVELDASVMHGPTHRAGAVAALRNIRNPAAVAREVARRTDHVLLVGDGALKFARRVGFKEEDLLTEKARLEWLKWRSTLSRDDDWLQEDEFDLPTGAERKQADAGDLRRDARGALQTTGTIHCSAVTPTGDLAGCTTTSGLSWKLPGRVGDSPIIGAGLYTDNAVGSAGATGRGEATLHVCAARTVVSRMEAGDTPTEACLAVLKLIADRTKPRRLLDDKGRPAFNVTLYALRKDGVVGSACLHTGGTWAVADEAGARVEKSVALFG